MKYSARIWLSWIAVTVVWLATPAMGQSVTMTVTWPNPTARPLKIGYPIDAGDAFARADREYADRWVQKVPTRIEARGERRVTLLFYYGESPLSTPVRVAPGQTEKQIVLDSEPMNCSHNDADRLEQTRRNGVGTQAVALKVAISAKRTLDSICSNPPRAVLAKLGRTLASALCDYANAGDGTFDLASFAPTVPSSLVTERTLAESCTRNRTGLVRVAIDEVNYRLRGNGETGSLKFKAAAVAQLLVLAKQADLAPVFAKLQFDPADYSGHLINMEYRELATMAATKTPADMETRRLLESSVARLQTIAAAAPGTDPGRAFAKSQLTPTDIDRLAAAASRLRALETIQEVLQASVPPRSPEPPPVAEILQAPDSAFDNLIADTAGPADADEIPS